MGVVEIIMMVLQLIPAFGSAIKVVLDLLDNLIQLIKKWIHKNASILAYELA